VGLVANLTRRDGEYCSRSRRRQAAPAHVYPLEQANAARRSARRPVRRLGGARDALTCAVTAAWELEPSPSGGTEPGIKYAASVEHGVRRRDASCVNRTARTGQRATIGIVADLEVRRSGGATSHRTAMRAPVRCATSDA
jgi:hypothetical protein